MQYSFASENPRDVTLMSHATDIIALRWGHLYQQLRQRIDNKHYHQGIALSHLRSMLERQRAYQTESWLDLVDVSNFIP